MWHLMYVHHSAQQYEFKQKLIASALIRNQQAYLSYMYLLFNDYEF